MSGVSSLPDPATHAYRKDLADTALAGQVIASHYAEPLVRRILATTDLRNAASVDSEVLGTLNANDQFRMLDSSLGWAWGYAPDGRVGYIAATAVAA